MYFCMPKQQAIKVAVSENMGSSFFHSAVCLDIQVPSSTKGFKVMMSIKCWWHIFVAIVFLWSKLLYIVPMFQTTFTNALFLSLYWCVVAHPSWLKNERKSSGCVPALSCTNTVFPENWEGVSGFIPGKERAKMRLSHELTALSSDFPAAGKARQVPVQKFSRKINSFMLRHSLFHCENTDSHWYLLLPQTVPAHMLQQSSTTLVDLQMTSEDPAHMPVSLQPEK